MGRWDVQVMGLDPGRSAADVVTRVAQRLGAEPAQVEKILLAAPSTLVTDLDEAAAKTLVQDLRLLGMRVKPRPAGAAPEPPVAPRASLPTTPVHDERATAPTVARPRPSIEAIDLGLPEASPTPSPSGSHRSPLEQLDEAALGAPSGLELDTARPPASVRPPPAAMVAPLPRIPSSPPPAGRGTPIETIDGPDEAPRVFWAALPAAFLVPLRAPVIGGLFLAPCFLGAAIVLSVLGTITALVGGLMMSSAFIGVTLQVSHRCLWATAVGERMPASLPSGFMSEYVFPGLTVVIVQLMLGGLAGWLGVQILSHGGPPIALQLGGLLLSLYMVIGFALAAASRSAMGFLDVARIVRILVKAPIPVIAIALVGGLVQGGAVAIAGVQFAAAYGSESGIMGALLALAGSTLVVSFAAAYGAALSATMMGMLFWARPDVANG